MISSKCGRCGVVSHMTPIAQMLSTPAPSWDHIIEAAFSCSNCQRLSVATNLASGFIERTHFSEREDAFRESWDDADWLPRWGEQVAFPDVPGHIAEAASEATLCQSVGAYRAVGSLARAVIEATAKDKEAAGRDLRDRINALRAADHIREHTKDQAHEVRYFGNTMAHGDFADPVTEEEAAEVIELMSEILDEVYQSPARLSRRREARRAKSEQQ